MAGYTHFWNCERCGERWETVDRPRVKVCDNCLAKAELTCPDCEGDGMVMVSWGEHFSQTTAAINDCPRCAGIGRIEREAPGRGEASNPDTSEALLGGAGDER